MYSDIKFKTLEELYKRILPALKSKSKELQKKGYVYIHEEDIWNFLKTFSWVNSKNLDLSTMVNDIFNLNEAQLDTYVKEEVKKYHREMNREEF